MQMSTAQLRRADCDETLGHAKLLCSTGSAPRFGLELAAGKTLASSLSLSRYIYLDTNNILVQPERHRVVEDRVHGQSEECHEAEEDEYDLNQHDGNLTGRAHEALYADPSATLRDVREAVTMLEDAERNARRVFGGAHPTTVGLGAELKLSRAALRARETPPTSG